MADDAKEPYGHDANYADPGYQNDGVKRYPCDSEAHVRAAWSYINQASNAEKYTADQLSAIKAHIKAAAKRFGIEISGESNNRAVSVGVVEPIGQVETRSADVVGVNFPQRVITVIAVPYGQIAPVLYRGEIWNEVFQRGAFAGIETRQRRIPVNREHNPEHLVGKVLDAWPDKSEGLVVDLRVAKTARGDETLALAEDDALSASVGYGLKRPGDQLLDRATHTRRIQRAFLDHLSLVGAPAYEGAKILSMRTSAACAAAPAPVRTPNLDKVALDALLVWARQKTDVV